ncbi:hypothetical protein [Nitrospirillum iridis]|uniref:Uncharacterized protein n=1 Tax=Nitrospirillum iridis TaxID=765888 RepID=A0A7X0AUI2_9PROT|nr:hypothetical protein [Nitrospirillum iridis]MBB6249566.1 hypothetical protein [Nitrospirillum iridis]
MPLYRDDYGALYWSLRGDVTGEVVRDTPFHKDAGTRMLRVRPGQERRLLWTLRGVLGLLALQAVGLGALAVALITGLVVIPDGWPMALASSILMPAFLLAMMTQSVLVPLSCESATLRHPVRLVPAQPLSLVLAPLLFVVGPVLYILGMVLVLPASARAEVAVMLGRADWAEKAAGLVLALILLACFGWAVRQCWLGWAGSRRRPPSHPPALRVAASREQRRDRTGS